MPGKNFNRKFMNKCCVDVFKQNLARRTSCERNMLLIYRIRNKVRSGHTFILIIGIDLSVFLKRLKVAID